MSVSTFVFGLLTICTAFAGSYGPLMAIRVLLGWAEAGIFPCIVTYFTMTYKREELGKRLSYIFSCSAISGAFGMLPNLSTVYHGLTYMGRRNPCFRIDSHQDFDLGRLAMALHRRRSLHCHSCPYRLFLHPQPYRRSFLLVSSRTNSMHDEIRRKQNAL